MKSKNFSTVWVFILVFFCFTVAADGQTIFGGMEHSLSICDDHTVMAWGRNTYGQLGTGNNTNRNVPVQITSLTGIKAVNGGRYHSLALKNDGTVWAWGRNVNGALGNGSNTESNVPVRVGSLSGMIAISGGEE